MFIGIGALIQCRLWDDTHVATMNINTTFKRILLAQILHKWIVQMHDHHASVTMQVCHQHAAAGRCIWWEKSCCSSSIFSCSNHHWLQQWSSNRVPYDVRSSTMPRLLICSTLYWLHIYACMHSAQPLACFLRFNHALNRPQNIARCNKQYIQQSLGGPLLPCRWPTNRACCGRDLQTTSMLPAADISRLHTHATTDACEP